MSELILYTTEDGVSRLQLRVDGGTIWLSQAEIAELFQTTPQNITTHVRTIYSSGEASEAATCKESLQGGKSRAQALFAAQPILAGLAGLIGLPIATAAHVQAS